MALLTVSPARPPGKNEICGLREMAVQTAAAEQGERVMPLGSWILERPAPPLSATYRSLLNISNDCKPRPSLVEPTLVMLAAGGCPLSAAAPTTFMMSPDLE